VIDVSGKFETLREAHARAIVRAKPETVDIVRAGKVPKGDVATSARVAGTLAAKKTSELIPLCHQVPLDWIKIDVTPGQDEIVVDVVVRTIWKTGVEVDALVAASVAALTVYDMLKPIDDGMTISDIRLIKKQGGVSQYTEAISPPLRTVVLVISDSTHAGRRVDKSGKTIVERLASQPVEVVEFKVLPDDVDLIRQELVRCCDELRADLVITTGGTGLGPKDLTVAATKGILDKEAPGIAEAVRAYGQKRTPYSMLSQGIAGVRKNTIIVTLPGSSRGAAESIDALFPGIVHAFRMVRGGGHD